MASCELFFLLASFLLVTTKLEATISPNVPPVGSYTPPAKPYVEPPKTSSPPYSSPPASVKPYNPPPKAVAPYTSPSPASPPKATYPAPPKAVAPYTSPSPASPPKATYRAPPKAVAPPTPSPYHPSPPPVKVEDCAPLCTARCRLHSRQGLCMRACSTCCVRCKCVPPGTYGNKELCGKCYTDMRTHGNRPKCP